MNNRFFTYFILHCALSTLSQRRPTLVFVSQCGERTS